MLCGFFFFFCKYVAFHSHFAHSLAGTLLLKRTTCWNLLPIVLPCSLLTQPSLAEHDRSPPCDTCSPSQLSTYLQVQYIPATQIKSHRSRRQLVLFIHTSLFSLFSNSPLEIIVQLSGHSTDRDVSGLVPCVCVKSCDPGQLHCEGDGSLTGYPIKEPERTNAPSREANEGEMRHHPQRSKKHSRCRTTLGGPGKV